MIGSREWYVVRSKPRRHFALHRLQCRRGFRGAQVFEGQPYAIESRASGIEGGHRVLERGRGRIRSERIDLGQVFFE